MSSYDTGRLYTLSQETNGSNLQFEENPNMMYMLVGSLCNFRRKKVSRFYNF